MTAVGFVGLGRMGIRMATNLADAGFPLHVWNRDPEKSHRLAARCGARIEPNPRSVAETSDVVVAMLADDQASAAVHSGDDGLFAARQGASWFLEMGTLSPDHVRGLARSADGRRVIDAPVSGSIDAASDAQLLIMVGAEQSDAGPVIPVLDAVGKTSVFLGEVGTASTMKLALNLVIHGLNQSLAEALAIATEAGIDAADAYSVFELSAIAAPMLFYRKPQYLDEAASPVSFPVSLARKDIELALELASGLSVPVPQAELNLARLTSAEELGYGQRDMASMFRFLREQS